MIDRDTIHVWRVQLDAMTTLPGDEQAARLESWRAMLSAEEQRRAGAFLALEHRQDYVAAHAALRFVLGMYLGVSPSLLDIGASGGTKPTLAVTAGVGSKDRDFWEKEWPDLRFNLSHTRGAVLIGIAIGRELGVDIEWQRPLDDLEGMARSVMSNEELLQWNALEPENRTRAFYRVWTRKESYLKAIGLGLFRNLQDVTVPVSADALEDAQRDSRRVLDRSGEGAWSVLDIPAWAGYSASVCWESAGVPPLVVRDLDIVRCDLAAIGGLR
jgi:4'-phosphopantetheinyl transferase